MNSSYDPEELFERLTPLCVATPAHARCRAIVVIPARNEEKTLAATLECLRMQRDLSGEPLDHDSYELLLLLNNCTDETAAVAEAHARAYPSLHLHILERTLPRAQAHVGTARRLLMDCACARLEQGGREKGGSACAILSTDADTHVAADWIACNLREIEAGAEVVGGVINLLPLELRALDPQTRQAYERDRELQCLSAKLESLLDPDPSDPWPRHQEHFGASLACTCEIYRLSGGLPPVKHLEDVAFVDGLRKVGARIRHSPDVSIQTSARLDGRAAVGLSGQLRHWRRSGLGSKAHMVDSAEWLEHRFRSMAHLRYLNDVSEAPDVEAFPEAWRQRLLAMHARRLPTPRFLEYLDCDSLIEEMFAASIGVTRYAEISAVLRRLPSMIRALEYVPVHQAEIVHAASV